MILALNRFHVSISKSEVQIVKHVTGCGVYARITQKTVSPVFCVHFLSFISTTPQIIGYTTNPTVRSAAATEHSTRENDLESSVGSHRALAEQWPSKSVECSVGFYR